ncbi:hypothetical protein [Vibrio owensii]|uniref:hypothetical protein n=1 Tax=Vibrio harveyi group TaxID=717610 RepID=UPI003CC6B645
MKNQNVISMLSEWLFSEFTSGKVDITAHHSDQPLSPETLFSAKVGISLPENDESECLFHFESVSELLTDILSEADFSDYQIESIKEHPIELIRNVASQLSRVDFSEQEVAKLNTMLRNLVDSDGCFEVKVVISNEPDSEGNPTSFETFISENSDSYDMDDDDQDFPDDDHIYFYDTSLQSVIHSMLNETKDDEEFILIGHCKASLISLLLEQ